MGLEEKLKGNNVVQSLEKQLVSDLKSVFGESTAAQLMSLISAKTGAWTGPPLTTAAPGDGDISSFYINPLLTDEQSGNAFSQATATNDINEVLDYIKENLTPSSNYPVVIYGIGEYRCELKNLKSVPQGNKGSIELQNYVSFYAPGWVFTTKGDTESRDVMYLEGNNSVHIKGIELAIENDVAFLKNNDAIFSSRVAAGYIEVIEGALTASVGIDVQKGILHIDMDKNNAVTATNVEVGSMLYYKSNITTGGETGESPTIPGGGGGATVVKLGKALFVSSAGKTKVSGAVRESLVNHYSLLAEAKADALDGDTIYVYGGTHAIGATNLYKDNIIYQFLGRPSITGTTTMFADSGAAGTCIVKGNAILSAAGGVFNFSGVGTIVDIEVESITATSGVAVQLVDTIGTINVSGTIHAASGATIYIDKGTNATINSKNITGLKTNGLTFNIRSGFTGRLLINASLITASPTVANSSVVFIDGTVGNLGETIFNVSDKIQLLGAGVTCQAVRPCNGNTIVNGNIDGGVGYAIRFFTPGVGSNFTHNGEAYNDGSLPAVQLSGSNAASMALNGTYKSANLDVIVQNNASSKLIVYGRIVNTNALAVSKSGVSVLANLATIFKNVDIILDGALGTPNCISAAAAKNVKVFHHVGSNFAAHANIANLITGTDITVDTDYE